MVAPDGVRALLGPDGVYIHVADLTPELRTKVREALGGVDDAVLTALLEVAPAPSKCPMCNAQLGEPHWHLCPALGTEGTIYRGRIRPPPSAAPPTTAPAPADAPPDPRNALPLQQKPSHDLVAADSHPFNDALLGAWAVYLTHYPNKGDSWRRMPFRTLMAQLIAEVVELEDALDAPVLPTKIVDELDDIVCSAVLMRGRVVMLMGR